MGKPITAKRSRGSASASGTPAPPRAARQPAAATSAQVLVARVAESQRWRWVLAAIVIGGLALRLAHLMAYSLTPEFAADRPPSDEFLYRHVAWSLYHEGPWATPAIGWVSSPTYVAFLLACQALADDTVWLPRILQCLLAVPQLILLFGIARTLFGLRAGLYCAGLAALYGPLVFYDALLLKASLGLTLFILTIWAALHAVRWRQRAAVHAGIGIAAALSVLSLSASSITLPVFAAWFWLRDRARPAPGAWTATIAFVLGAALLLAPFALRDRFAPDGQQVFARGAGIHVYLGNHPGATGTYTRLEGIRANSMGHVVEARQVAEARTGRTLSPQEVSDFWMTEGLRFWRESPADALELLGRKAWLFLRAAEIPNGEDFHRVRESSLPLKTAVAGWWLVLPLALVGLVAVRRREAGFGLLVALLVVVSVAVCLVFVTGRYRLPAVPMLLVLAGAGAGWLHDAWATRRWPALLVALAALIVLTGLLSL